MSRKCGDCSYYIDDNEANFCPRCGSRNVINEEDNLLDEEYTNNNSYQELGSFNQVEEERPRKKKKRIYQEDNHQDNSFQENYLDIYQDNNNNNNYQENNIPQQFFNNSAYNGGGKSKVKTKKKKRDNKKTQLIVLIIGIALVVISGALFGVKYLLGAKEDKDTIVVGNDNVGYLRLPNNWFIYESGDNSPNTAYYTDGNGWFAVWTAIPKGETTPYDWGVQIMNTMQQQNATNIDIAQVRLNNYQAQKVVCYYPEKQMFFAVWLFNTSDGRTHYLAVEGPEMQHSNYNIPYTFAETRPKK